ncbi:MAG: methyltransferase domain-containing protein [Candidatus Eisenbacteria bacterium]|uniref:Methyltransferase domain-containing protein n=1 Tax=Eiseniibacteriota bacterium TaxID=2212470 RepID=A0A938BPX3_UNCEI|nr:methyltransferase domain-containing protein [Candidatus Eisenbacteria bacterium]
MRSSTPGHWERYWRERREIDQVYTNEDRLLDQLRELPLERMRALEVGAGSGRDSLRLVQAGARVFLLDYVMSAFEVIRPQAAALGLRVECVCGDATRMPFRDGAFDLVFHQGLLEHFRDPRPLLDEGFRVTAGGGYGLIDVPQRYHPYTLVKHLLIALDRWFAGWETEFTPGGLSRLMRAAGYEVLRVGGDWMVPGFWYRSLRYALLRVRLARLPQYPREIPLLGPLGRSWRGWLRRRRLGPYTFAMVNVLARRPAASAGRRA